MGQVHWLLNMEHTLMPKLPNPEYVNRKAPQPGGPVGHLQASQIGTPQADTSIGDALQGIGDEAYKFAMAEKKRMDGVAVDDAKNQYLQQALELESEYSEIKGKNAVDQDIVQDYKTKLDGISEKITSGFKNNSQRKSWDSYYGRSKVQFNAGVMRHKLAESDRYAGDTYKSTNILRVQNAHSNWADSGVVNNSATDIVNNIAKEKLRSGWDDARTEVELKDNLGPLWSGVAAQYINAKQYKMAKKILDQHQDVIGVDKHTSYHKSIEASETIDLSQEKAAHILETIKDEKEQRKAARKIGGTLGDATLQRVKTFQNEERIQKQETKKAQAENDLKWISKFGVEALNNNTLTIDQVESAGLSDDNDALWKQKVFNQAEDKEKEALVKQTKNSYANWIEKATINPDRYTEEDVAKDIDPNGGGLTGPQFNNVVSIMSSHQVKTQKTATTQANNRGKTQLKSMYDRGDFGEVETGKDKFNSDSWEDYSNILIEYQQKIIDEPNIDHTDWLNEHIRKKSEDKLYEELDADITWGPFQDESDQIISEHLLKKNIIATPEDIEAVRKKYKLDKLGVVPEAEPSEKTNKETDEEPLNDPAGIR